MKTEIINCDCCGRVVDETEQKNIGIFNIELVVRSYKKSSGILNPRLEHVCRECTDNLVFCVNESIIESKKIKELSDGK